MLSGLGFGAILEPLLHCVPEYNCRHLQIEVSDSQEAAVLTAPDCHGRLYLLS